MHLNALIDVVYRTNVRNGWFDIERPLSADIALLHSEVSEAYEAFRKGSDLSHSGNVLTGGYDPNSFPAEIADIFIRLLDTCKRYDIDLTVEFLKKNYYNRNRSYRHGGKAE